MAQWFAGRFSGKKDSAALSAHAPPANDARPRPPAQGPPRTSSDDERPAEAPRRQTPQPVVLEVSPQLVALAVPPAAKLPPPLPTIDSYTMKQTLGVGAFGKVKLAEHKETGELFAIKCIQKSRVSAARQFERLQRCATRAAVVGRTPGRALGPMRGLARMWHHADAVRGASIFRGACAL